MLTKRVEIIFLDDDPRACEDLVAALEQCNYIVHQATAHDQAEKLIVNRQIHLLIHGTLRSKTNWETCDQLTAKYPSLPVLHVRIPDTCIEHGLDSDQFSSQYHLLTSVESFLGQVEELVALSRRHIQETFGTDRASRLREWKAKFTALDFASTFHNSAEFVCREFAAVATLWIPEGRLKGLVDILSPENEKLFEVQTSPMDAVAAWPNQNLMAWDAVFKAWQQELRSGKKMHNGQPWTIQRGEETDVFLPITDLADGDTIGYFFLVGAQGWNIFLDDEVVEDTMRTLCQQWTFCRDFEREKFNSFYDDLTPLFNQRYLSVVLEREIGHSRKNGDAFSVLFMDIDHFKRVNDSLGHLVGSRVLISLAKLLQSKLRPQDYGFRYGGDEFVAILTGTGQEDAEHFAEDIRQAVEAAVFDELGHKVSITLSVGVASYPQNADSLTQVLWLADQAMYSSKSQGRNRVYLAS